jgi:hypothetical protein
VNQRDAKRQATSRTATMLREVARRYLDITHENYRSIPNADRHRFARAYTELADELDRRLEPGSRRVSPVTIDPAQISLFEEQE